MRLILDECGNADNTADLVEAQLSLVEYSILSICSPEEERHMVWEEERERKCSELTNAGIVASNLLGTPASGTDSFVVNQGDVTLVSFVISEENREETSDERVEREERLRNEGTATPVPEDMEVDGFGDTQARSTTIATPIVQNIDLPLGAEIPSTAKEIAWGALERADEDMIFMHQMIRHLRRNATDMNPVDLLESRRMLEQTAANGSVAAQMALKLLDHVLSNVQDDLVICHVCAWGANPGVQHCPRCSTAFTTLLSWAQEIVESSASSLLSDAAVCCLGRGREGNPNPQHETGRQPVDMDGTFPQKCRPGPFSPELLNITYFAQENIAEQIQAQERPPLNPKKDRTRWNFSVFGQRSETESDCK